MHDCFTRELKEGTRPIDADPGVLVSPCDAIVGAAGTVSGTELLQIKGAAYTLRDLFGDSDLVGLHRDGCYVTLRLTVGMYHRFHAPHDTRVESVTYISGDTWNVNPIALKRVEKLFCKNERALIRTKLTATGHVVTLVPVAAILVASIRLHFVHGLLDLARRGPALIACNAQLRKGEEMGWFQHGSTIILFAPAGFRLCAAVKRDARSNGAAAHAVAAGILKVGGAFRRPWIPDATAQHHREPASGRSYHLETDHAHDYKKQAPETGDIGGFAEEDDPDHDRSRRSDARPQRVRGSERHRLQRNAQQCEAERDRRQHSQSWPRL